MERIRRVSGGSYSLSVSTLDDDGVPVTVASPLVRVYDGGGVKVGADGTPSSGEGPRHGCSRR